MNSNDISYSSFSSPSQSTLLKPTANQPLSFQSVLSGVLGELKEGQVVKGVVLDLKGNELKLQLSNTTTLQAFIDSDVNLNIGDVASFEVSEATSALILKLLEDTSSPSIDNMIDKALEEAGIVNTDKTASYVKALLSEQLSIDKGSLQLLNKYACTFKDASVSDLAFFMKHELPINDITLSQFQAYKENEYSLLNQLTNLSDSYVDALQKEAQGGDETLIAASQEESQIVSESGDSLINKSDMQALNDISVSIPEILSDSIEIESSEKPLLSFLLTTASAELEAPLPDDVLSSLKENTIPELENALSKEQISAKDLLSVSLENNNNNNKNNNDNASLLPALLANDSFKQYISSCMQKHFSLSVNELKNKGISSFYERLEDEISSLNELMKMDKSDSYDSLFVQNKSVQDNIEFMKSLNSMLFFAQLPLQLKDKNIHSELYVYKKRKDLSKNSNDISILLHLNMEHMGPTDIHLTMYHKNVQAKFFVAEDCVELIQTHLPAFTKHLSQMGYYLNYSVTKQEKEHYVLDEFKKDEENFTPLKKYNFDKRA